jgi:hypothetical protein
VPDTAGDSKRLLPVEHANVVNPRQLRLREAKPAVENRIVIRAHARLGALRRQLLLHINHRPRRRHERGSMIMSSPRLRPSGDTDGKLVEILQTPRRHGWRFPRRDHESESLGFVRERNLETDNALRQREQLELRFNHDPESSFTSHKPVDRIVRESIPCRVLLEAHAAVPHDFAGREHYGHRADVLASCAVLECAGTRRVARDRSADGALLLARRVGREQQPCLRRYALHFAKDRAGAGANRSSVGVHLDQRTHSAQRQENPAVSDRSSRGARLHPCGCHWRARTRRAPHDFHHFLD